MPIFDQLQQASFNEVPFPCEDVEVIGGIRDHIHEYPHSPGGAVEKMGRKLYTVRMTAPFHVTFPKYPNLWPLGLSRLRGFFEDQTTGPLVIPTIGTIQAYARSWTQSMNSKVSSGEKAVFEFVEDEGQARLIGELISVNVTSVERKVKDFDAQKALTDFAGDSSAISLFDAITDAANSVLAVADQIELAGNLFQAKISYLIDLCKQADRLIFVQNPQNFPLTNFMHDLWNSAIEVQQNVQKSDTKPKTYIVPTTMSMSAISTALYGNSNHSVELMQINPVEDVFAVPAGFQITFYPTLLDSPVRAF